jgi:hypothetical protein
VERLVLKTVEFDSPKAQISGGKAAILSNALRTTQSTLALKKRFKGCRTPLNLLGHFEIAI